MINEQLESFWEDSENSKSPEDREKFYSYVENIVSLELQIRGNNIEYTRQYKIGAYSADFYFPKLNLVLEIDGMHHNTGEAQEHDRIRDEFMNKKGYKVVRVDASLAKRNPSGVVDSLRLFPQIKTYVLKSQKDINYLQQLSVGIIDPNY